MKTVIRKRVKIFCDVAHVVESEVNKWLEENYDVYITEIKQGVTDNLTVISIWYTEQVMESI